MRDLRLAFLRRAAAPISVSLALHAVVAAGASSILSGEVLGLMSVGDGPLVVEIVAGDVRAQPPAPRRQVARSAPVPVTPAPAPAVPARGEASVATESEGPAAEGPALARPETDDASVATEAEVAEGPVPLAAVAPAPAPEVVPHAGSAAIPEVTPGGADSAQSPVAHVSPGDPALGSSGSVEARPAVSALSRLGEVTRNPSVSARAESEPLVGRREVFEFLLDHPDFATHLTRALRLARYRVWRTDDGMFIDDGWGATGQLTVIHAASGSRVLYAKGEFQHRFLPTIPGEAVVTIDYDAWPGEDGREMLHARISGQLKIDGGLAALMLKVASSVATEKAEKESRRLMKIMARVLRAIDETPAAVYASLRERPDVPRVELEQFRVLLRLP